MPKTTKRNEKLALAKARRKVRVKLKAKQKSRTDSKKGLGLKKTASHPHRVTSAKRVR
jgi:hypothetical protein